MTELSIIIPAYNEEDRIVHTLTETIAYLSTAAHESEIIVVSDGSTDNTCSVVNGFEPAEHIRLSCLEYHPNRGKGYAVRYGMSRGRFDIVMFMDADYSVPMKEVEKGVNLIHQGADIAIASRAIEGATVNQRQNLVRAFSAKVYTFIQNHYLGIHYKDTQCGFKLFKRGAAQELFPKQRLDSVIFDPEILWLARQSGLKVREFPVEWTHVEDSRIQYDSFKKSLFVFQELLRIKTLH